MTVSALSDLLKGAVGETYETLAGAIGMEVVVHIVTILGHLALNVTLSGNVLPELAGVGSPRNSASKADDDGGVILTNVDTGGHFEKFRCQIIQKRLVWCCEAG